MPHSTVTVALSLTEVPHFRRLVQFLNDAEDLGRVNADDEVLKLVNECRQQLADISTNGWEKQREEDH